MKIGIIGAESTHSTCYAKTINLEKCFDGVQITSIWGETFELAEKTAQLANIPKVVTNPQDMLGTVDAVIIAHRNGSKHLAVAELFLKAKVPMFIDKPLCCHAKEARDFLQRCKNADVPIASFSAMPLQQNFFDFKEELANAGKIYSLNIIGWADYQSPYDGLFFYGYHHIEMCQSIMGLDLLNWESHFTGKHLVGLLHYSQDRTATLSMNQEAKGHDFAISAYTEKGFYAKSIVCDANPYLENMKIFIKMFQTGKSLLDYEKLIQAIQVLEDFQGSTQKKD